MTAELPPPSGPPQPNPDVDAAPRQASAVTTALPYAAPPPMMPPGAPGPVGAGLPPMGAMPSTGSLSSGPVPTPGTNGLAIAALCCGLVGIFPIAAVVAIVLGAVALSQLKRRIQRGRGMAVTGIVLGILWLVGWTALVVVAVATDEPTRTSTGAVAASTDAFVEDLKAGDCFSGAGRDEVDSVTILPCASAHESQVVTIYTMPAGPWPGEEKVVEAAEKGCSAQADPLITDQAYDDLRPSFIYPQDEYSWRGNREIICVVEAPKGTTTGSALR